MGLTTDSLQRLNRNVWVLIGDGNKPVRMLELGCQNIYDNSFPNVTYGMVAKDYFKAIPGLEHTSWDITGCQCSEKVDLREPVDIKKTGQFDIITDYGTTEHIEGNYYMAQKNIHDLCKMGGYRFHEIPKTGHWIGHGFNYVTIEFFTALAKDNGYEIIELTEHFALGNITDGCLICCVMKKVKDVKFVSEKKFNTYDVRSS